MKSVSYPRTFGRKLWRRIQARARGSSDRGQTTPPLIKKEEQWQGYYRYYLSEAQRQGVNVLQILDEQWYDSRKTASCVLPHLSGDSVVLEIACGLGRFSRFIAPNCGQLYCTDVLDEALVEARKNLANFSNVSFQKTSGYDLSDFSAAQFDCVYSFTAFFHFDFELVVHYFSEIRRVLKTGGVAIIEFKRWIDQEDVVQLLDKIEHQGGIKVYEIELDKWRYVSKEMLRLVCDYYGLEVIDDDTTKFTFTK